MIPLTRTVSILYVDFEAKFNITSLSFSLFSTLKYNFHRFRSIIFNSNFIQFYSIFLHARTSLIIYLHSTDELTTSSRFENSRQFDDPVTFNNHVLVEKKLFKRSSFGFICFDFFQFFSLYFSPFFGFPILLRLFCL